MSLFLRDGKYYQRRRQPGFDGKLVNILEKQVDCIIGSGNHVRTCVHRTPGNKLMELPLAWDAEKGGYWAMNPGYFAPDQLYNLDNDLYERHNLAGEKLHADTLKTMRRQP